jgi:hypothetical protein
MNIIKKDRIDYFDFLFRFDNYYLVFFVEISLYEYDIWFTIFKYI